MCAQHTNIIHNTGTWNLTLDLTGNFIARVDPTSFPGGVALDSDCDDAFGWAARCEEFAEINDNKVCSHRESCEDTALLLVQDDRMTALSACCAFGGGFSSGVKLLMESASPLRCAVSSSNINNVVCECSDETQRYDVMTSSCISSCLSGERWEDFELDAQEYHM